MTKFSLSSFILQESLTAAINFCLSEDLTRISVLFTNGMMSVVDLNACLQAKSPSQLRHPINKSTPSSSCSSANLSISESHSLQSVQSAASLCSLDSSWLHSRGTPDSVGESSDYGHSLTLRCVPTERGSRRNMHRHSLGSVPMLTTSPSVPLFINSPNVNYSFYKNRNILSSSNLAGSTSSEGSGKATPSGSSPAQSLDLMSRSSNDEFDHTTSPQWSQLSCMFTHDVDCGCPVKELSKNSFLNSSAKHQSSLRSSTGELQKRKAKRKRNVILLNDGRKFIDVRRSRIRNWKVYRLRKLLIEHDRRRFDLVYRLKLSIELVRVVISPHVLEWSTTTPLYRGSLMISPQSTVASSLLESTRSDDHEKQTSFSLMMPRWEGERSKCHRLVLSENYVWAWLSSPTSVRTTKARDVVMFVSLMTGKLRSKRFVLFLNNLFS